MIPHEIRPLHRRDAAFVHDSWLREMAADLEIPKEELPRRRFWQAHAPRLRALVARPDTTVLVAHAPGAPDDLIGWVAFTGPDRLHFVYTRGGFRRGGVARALLAAAKLPPETVCTHYTAVGINRLKPMFARLLLQLDEAMASAA